MGLLLGGGAQGVGEIERRLTGKDRLAGHGGHGRDPGEGGRFLESPFRITGFEVPSQQEPLIAGHPVQHEEGDLGELLACPFDGQEVRDLVDHHGLLVERQVMERPVPVDHPLPEGILHLPLERIPGVPVGLIERLVALPPQDDEFRPALPCLLPVPVRRILTRQLGLEAFPQEPVAPDRISPDVVQAHRFASSSAATTRPPLAPG